MKRVFLYNPENDIALASGLERFTPPKNAALLSFYGAPLMWWMGDADDYVLVSQRLVEEHGAQLNHWLQLVEETFGAGPSVVTDLHGLSVGQLSPWGWSHHSFHSLKEAGAPSELLDKWGPRLESIRNLSHRRTAADVNRRLLESVDFCRYGQEAPCQAFEARDMGEVERFGQNHKLFYFKSPWSSSGRGVGRSDIVSGGQLQARCEGIIRHQGSVLLEKGYDKADDFAMLFECAGGEVRFHGYSLFFNAHGAAYGGNVIASDDEIKNYLTRKINGSLLDEVRDSLEKILGEIVGNAYEGFLGVDMMIAHERGAFAIVPCVELNLRMTMGVVAHAVNMRMGNTGGRRLMKVLPGGRGKMCNDVVRLVPENGYFDIVVEQQPAVGIYCRTVSES